MARSSTLVFDRDSIQAVDRAAVNELGIPGVVLMENASLGLVPHVLELLGTREAGGRETVLICCGSGNNGGDGYALARHLHNRGLRPLLAPLAPPRPATDAAINAEICRRLALPAFDGADRAGVPAAGLIIDALFGTGLDRAIEGEAAAWVSWMNGRDEPVLAVDVPSGLDCNRGVPLGPTVRATRTVTFVGLKQGFLEPSAAEYTGELHVTGIGAPPELAEKYGRRRSEGSKEQRNKEEEEEGR